MTEEKEGDKPCGIYSRSHFIEVVRNFDLYMALSDNGFRCACENTWALYSLFNDNDYYHDRPSDTSRPLNLIMADALFLGLYFEESDALISSYWVYIINRIRKGLDPELGIEDHIGLTKILLFGPQEQPLSNEFEIRAVELREALKVARTLYEKS